MKKGKESNSNKKSAEPKKAAATKRNTSKRPSKLKPHIRSQTGDYQRHVHFRFTLPYQFLLQCRLMDVTPDQVLTDFMDNLSCSSWKREGRDKAKETLIDYFLEHGYWQHHYLMEDVRTIFKKLYAIGLLWPNNAKMKLIDLHAKWRDKYHHYWFKKWFRKPRRKVEQKPFIR